MTKILANSQRLIVFLTWKNFDLKNKGLGSGIQDLGFGIQKKPIPDPRSRGQKSTRSRIRIRNTGPDIPTRRTRSAKVHRENV